MTVKDRDPLTGHQTTGHEWNGITELNTRVPHAIWWFILVSHLYALIAWILLPAWPGINSYTRGVLGIDQRDRVERQVAEMQLSRAPWRDRIAALPVAEIRADPALSAIVASSGPALFGDNCAACHGPRGQGGPGFPSLVDDAWLWGGSPEAIGKSLLEDFLIPFEAASMLLLIAAVGAVVLAARRPPLDSPDVEEPSILNPPEGGV